MGAVKLTMLLCDHATVAEGKLYINGAGWSVTGPEPSPSSSPADPQAARPASASTSARPSAVSS